MAQIGTDIDEAKRILGESGVVGIPTETVYGLAGNALSEKAILKIFEVKNRPKFDPLIAHVSNLSVARKLITDFPEPLKKLSERFWPGPLTLLLPKQSIVPDLLTSGSNLVAIRVPSHPLTLQLLNDLEFPLAAPSANPFGYVSPTTPAHVDQQLGNQISYILNGGESNIGLESTIVGYDGGVIVHRVGGLAVERIEEVVGPVKLALNQSSNPVAPGMLKSHYSPGKKVIVGDLEHLIPIYSNHRVGIISFKKKYKGEMSFCLSENGDLDEAASKLFSALRKLDHPNIDIVLTESFPAAGLGRAINDRLKRASA